MNKSGFTLVELLATIVVIAIVMSIVMPSASRVSRKNKKRIYQEYENMMVEYAKVSPLNKNDSIDLFELDELDNVKKECTGHVSIDHSVDPPKYQAFIDCGENQTVIE